jgi:S1-C subfamily serine protease
MMRRGIILLIYALFFFIGIHTYAVDNIEDLLKAVVRIQAQIPEDAYTANVLGTKREGNGVVIDESGHVLTIGYLIIEAERIEITGPKGETVTAKYVGYDFNTGFGLLLPDQPLKVAPMQMGQSSALKEGDHLFVASFGGLDSVQTVQVLSLMEFAGYWEYLLESAIYTAPTYRNYGGAALIGQDGRLVGIGSLYTSLSVPGLGTIPSNIFVPIDLLRPILTDLISKGRSKSSPRPWLGLNAQESLGHVIIIRVTPEGPAEQAGIRRGDIILSVNGEEVNNLADFYRKVWALGNAGVNVDLTVLQGVQIHTITVESVGRTQFLKLTSRGRIVRLMQTHNRVE